MLDRIGVDQPEWSALTSMDDINAFIDKVGFPVLVRPSYVLSGAAMNVCSNQEELERFLNLAANVSKKHPVVVSRFIENAKEVEMDAVKTILLPQRLLLPVLGEAHGGNVYIGILK